MTLTNYILVAAIEGFDARKRTIEDKIAEIRQMLIGGPTETPRTPGARVGNRKQFSAASRKKMGLAQKARWARIKGGSEQSPDSSVVAVPKAKRQISADGLKRIAAAQRQRWAEKKAKAAEAQPRAKKVAVKKVPTKKAPVKKTTARTALTQFAG
jgi:hypothetical protein